MRKDDDSDCSETLNGIRNFELEGHYGTVGRASDS